MPKATNVESNFTETNGIARSNRQLLLSATASSETNSMRTRCAGIVCGGHNLKYRGVMAKVITAAIVAALIAVPMSMLFKGMGFLPAFLLSFVIMLAKI